MNKKRTAKRPIMLKTHGQIAHLVNAVVAVAVFGRVLAVFASFGAAHDSHRFPSFPVFGLGAFLLIHRRVAVQSKSPANHKPTIKTRQLVQHLLCLCLMRFHLRNIDIFQFVTA